MNESLNNDVEGWKDDGGAEPAPPDVSAALDEERAIPPRTPRASIGRCGKDDSRGTHTEWRLVTL